ncbi:MAG TPA: hypothetical protein VHE82_01275 [Gemmatimonadaceae bacterium]|nr:hypothetical protein [Gemmatimonadaceae bacterium]
MALAAVLAGGIPLRGRDIAVMVLSGGNIDVNLVGRITRRSREIGRGWCALIATAAAAKCALNRGYVAIAKGAAAVAGAVLK